MRIALAAAAAALALAVAAPGAAAQYDCQGTVPGDAPKPKAGGAPLVFGIYPLAFAGRRRPCWCSGPPPARRSSGASFRITRERGKLLESDQALGRN